MWNQGNRAVKRLQIYHPRSNPEKLWFQLFICIASVSALIYNGNPSLNIGTFLVLYVYRLWKNSVPGHHSNLSSFMNRFLNSVFYLGPVPALQQQEQLQESRGILAWIVTSFFQWWVVLAHLQPIEIWMENTLRKGWGREEWKKFFFS